MKLVKINYEDEIFSDYEYIEYPKDKVLKVGMDIIVNSGGTLKHASVLKIEEGNNDSLNSNFVRIVNKRDKDQHRRNKKDSEEALIFAQDKASELDLSMYFISSYYTFDRKQLFISYVADNRVDFRELAKILAQRYKTRIELRQIGVRDRAKKTGGLGPCGLFLCCSTFLTEFASVSINMAKNQFLALNPTKINGLCGRLLCCLNYEDEVYTELKKGLPSIGNLVETKEGLGKVTEVDVFKRTYKAEFKDKGVFEFSVNE